MKQSFALMGFTYLFCVFISNAFDYTISIILSALSILLSIVIAILILKFKKQVGKILIVAVTAIVAFGAYGINCIYNVEPLQELKGQDLQIKGQLVEPSYESYGKSYYILESDTLDCEKEYKSIKIRLSSIQSIPLELNETIKCKVHISESNLQDNSLFNSENYLKSQGIYLSGFIYEYENYQIISTDEDNIFKYPYLWREHLSTELRSLTSKESSSILCAVLLGDKLYLDDDMIDNFRTTGVAHIICVSGLHLSTLAGILFILLSGLRVNFRLSAFISMIFILAFMILVGFSTSVVRAGVMSILYYFGIMTGRRIESFNSLGMSLLIMCLINPFAGENISLLLSAFSTVGIITIYPKAMNYLKESYKFINFRPIRMIVETIVITLSATIFTFPILVLVFKEISIISMLSNLLIVFPCTIMLIAVVFFLCVYLICGLNFISELLLYISSQIAKYIYTCITSLASLPFASVRFQENIILPCMFSVLILFAVLFISNKVKKYFKISVLLSLIMVLFGIISYNISDFGKVKLTVFSTTTGCSVVMTRGDNTAVLCCGGNSYTDNKMSDFLKSRELQKPDFVLLSYIDENVSYCDYNIINNYTPNIIFLSDKSELDDKTDRCLKDKENIFTYTDKLNLKIWDEVEIKSITTDTASYIFVKINNMKVLIVPMGDDVPEELQGYYDFIVTSEIPTNYQSIHAEYCIASMNEEDTKSNFYRFVNFSDKLIATCGNGDITLEFSENEGICMSNSSF